MLASSLCKLLPIIALVFCKSILEPSISLTNILHETLETCDEINDVFGVTCDLCGDLVDVVCGCELHMITFHNERTVGAATVFLHSW